MPAIKLYRLKNSRLIGFTLGFFLFFIFYFNILNLDFSREALIVAGIVLLMAVFWISMCIPIAVTSLIPIVLFPVFGIMSSNQAVKYYANNNIYLFLGGFIIALAIERVMLHKRLALWITYRLGNSKKALILGFMLGTAILSMWISNTATALMMLPIGMAVVSEIGEKDRGFATALMLSIAYAASIGGIATPIGTPPNIVFLGIFEKSVHNGADITFFKWLKVFIPLTFIILPVVWFMLIQKIKSNKNESDGSKDLIKDEIEKLGKMSRGEKRVLIVFIVTALLWIFRSDIVMGGFKIPGWSNLFRNPKHIHDATVAIFMSIILFVIPKGDKSSEKLMDWETARKVPWGILLLFGGGFAIAGGFSKSGLDKSIGHALQPYLVFHPVVIVLIICLIVTFLTELTSNTATTAALLPIMMGTAVALKLDPLLLMIPATISASMAFMLPVATPPNAIVFSSGRVTMGEMAKTGFLINIIVACIVTLYVYFIALPLLR